LSTFTNGGKSDAKSDVLVRGKVIVIWEISVSSHMPNPKSWEMHRDCERKSKKNLRPKWQNYRVGSPELISNQYQQLR